MYIIYIYIIYLLSHEDGDELLPAEPGRGGPTHLSLLHPQPGHEIDRWID